MQLPPIGEEPDEAWWAEFKALPLIEQLRIARTMTERIHGLVCRLFPGETPPAPDTRHWTLEQKLAAGEQVARDLHGVAMSIAPEVVLDRMDKDLPKHAESRNETAALLGRLKSGAGPASGSSC